MVETFEQGADDSGGNIGWVLTKGASLTRKDVNIALKGMACSK